MIVIPTELIARAICQYGKCKTCDPDCVDYKAAQRVAQAIVAEATQEVSNDGKEQC